VPDLARPQIEFLTEPALHTGDAALDLGLCRMRAEGSDLPIALTWRGATQLHDLNPDAAASHQRKLAVTIAQRAAAYRDRLHSVLTRIFFFLRDTCQGAFPSRYESS
jgi:hypothetical protein